MRHVRPISEDEMVAVFLQTELASTRFCPPILEILARLGCGRRIIDQPDLSDAVENARHRTVLGEYRGAEFPELLLIGKEKGAPLVVLEGHARLTAYCLRPACMPQELPVLVGYAPEMDK